MAIGFSGGRASAPRLTRRHLPQARGAAAAESPAHDGQPVGARIADRLVLFLGSWRFIAIQTVLVLVWLLGNIYLVFRFDPYPFILLNLAFSTQAAYAAPIILLASNRAAARDRRTLEHAAAEADLEESQNERLIEGNEAILARVEALEQCILELEGSILEVLRDGRPPSGSSTSRVRARRTGR